jgi:hypothetical protein
MSVPDALDKYIGVKDFIEGVRKKFTNLEEAMVYAEELDLEQQKSIITSRSVGNFSKRANYEGAVASRPLHQSRLGQDLTPEAGHNPHGIGFDEMSETERNRHLKKDLCFNHQPGHRANTCPSRLASRETIWPEVSFRPSAGIPARVKWVLLK